VSTGAGLTPRPSVVRRRRVGRRAGLQARPRIVVRFVQIYLIGYFVLVAGALLALWRAGILARVGAPWIAIGLIVVVGLGIVLAVTSAKPTITD